MKRKNNIRIIILLCAVALVQSCKEQRFSIGDRPSVDQFSYSVSPDPESLSTIHFSFNGDQLSPFWTIEQPNGTYLRSSDRNLTIQYMLAGEYKGVIQAFGSGGLSDSVYFNFTVPESDPIVYKLTGKTSQKVWVWDYMKEGHLTGIWSDPGGAWEGVWALVPNELKDYEIYDDELSFISKNNEYKLDAHGFIYADPSVLKTLDPANYPDGGKVGATIKYTQPEGQKWSIRRDEKDKLFLSFSEGAFPSYPASPAALGAEYEIVELSDDLLHLFWQEFTLGEIVSWHYYFVPKQAN